MAIIITALALVSCAEQDGNPYAEDIAAAKASAETDFERSVFDDNKITRAEYEEAEQRYVKCLETKGATVSLVDQGGYYGYQIVGDANAAAYDDSKDGCRKGTTYLIEPLYVDQLRNPQKAAFEELVAKCFIDHGVAPENFTASDFRALVIDNPKGLQTANEPGSKWQGYDYNPDTNPDAKACLDAY